MSTTLFLKFCLFAVSSTILILAILSQATPNTLSNPFFVTSNATVALPTPGTDVILSIRNSSHILALDSQFMIHVFQYSEQNGINFTRSASIAAIGTGVMGNSWSHWRDTSAVDLSFHPTNPNVLYAVTNFFLSSRKIYVHVLDTSTFSAVQTDTYDLGRTSESFFTADLYYPRIATYTPGSFIFIGVYNDGTLKSPATASGFWLSKHSLSNPLNPSRTATLSSASKRVLLIHFVCNGLQIVCLWTSPYTIEEYSLTDLSFLKTYNVTIPFTSLRFDSAKDMDGFGFTYYLHPNVTKADEIVAHKRNSTHQTAVGTLPYTYSFPYNTPNLKIRSSSNNVLAGVTTSLNSSIGLGETEIVVCSLNTSLELQSSVVLSTIRQDNMTELFAQSNGGFMVVGNTLGQLNSPTSNSATNQLFTLQFAPLKVKTLTTSTPMAVMMNEIIKIEFDSVPTPLLSIVPVISMDGKNFSNAYWNGTLIHATVPAGTGGPFALWIKFNSLVQFNPSIKLDGYSYAYSNPEIASVSPLRGPTVGFNLTILFTKLDVPNQFTITVTIGAKLCMNVVQVNSTAVQCTVPPGTGRDHLVAVSIGLILNSTEAVSISYDSPSLTDVAPPMSSTGGGTLVSVTGGGFGPCTMAPSPCSATDEGITVTIGGNPCYLPKLYTDSLLTCVIPEGFGVNLTLIVVVNSQNSVNSLFFSYDRPRITGIVPQWLQSSNPTVYLEGANFGVSSNQRVVEFREANTSQIYTCPVLTWLSHNSVKCLPLFSRFTVNITVEGQHNSDIFPQEFRTGLIFLPPTVQPLQLTVDEDETLFVELIAFDFDDGDAVQLFVMSNPQNGTLYQITSQGKRGALIDASLLPVPITNSQSRIFYVPSPNFNGLDYFRIMGRDRQNIESSAQFVNITVTSVPDPPLPRSVQLTLDEDTAVAVPFCADDPDHDIQHNMTFTILALPKSGQLFINNGTAMDLIADVPFNMPHNTTSATFVPLTHGHGEPYATIVYKVNDGQLESVINGTITLNVKPINDLPTFTRTSLNLSVFEDTPSIFELNITDVDISDIVSVKISNLHINGSLYRWDKNLRDSDVINTSPLGENSEIKGPPYQLYFVPKLHFYTTDISSIQRFNISYSDRVGGFTEEISFSVAAVNDPPRIQCNTIIDLSTEFVTNINGLMVIRIDAVDVDNNELVFHTVAAPSRGVLRDPVTNETLMTDSTFNSTTLTYYAPSNGSEYPFPAFTIFAEDASQERSENCVYQFRFSCPAGKFHNVFKSSGPICDDCPTGAVCSHDGSRMPSPAFGYWRADDNTTYLPCFPVDACPGNPQNICARGYEGQRCARCSRGYYRVTNSCRDCAQNSSTVQFITTCAVLAGLSIFFAICKSKGIGTGQMFVL
ncbi:hypothetical protein BKA69DRAFT_186087 [Paraphysoderma sedebokerense]|nr:hypothetical protein BKA69DRAFT_186087 [Paraphysoderma sedebokerense]